MKRLLVFPRAEQDLDELAEHIAKENLDAALGLYAAANAAFRRLAEMPDIGVKREFLDPKLTHLRMWPIPGYSNMLVFYDVLGDDLRVVRILHSSRDIAALFSK